MVNYYFWNYKIANHSNVQLFGRPWSVFYTVQNINCPWIGSREKAFGFLVVSMGFPGVVVMKIFWPKSGSMSDLLIEFLGHTDSTETF